MSTVTFNVSGEVYTLSEEIKQYFLSRLEPSDSTLQAYFEDGELVHRYVDDDGDVEESVVDVVEIFETYPSEARRVLDNVGAKPTGMAVQGGLVDLREWR